MLIAWFTIRLLKTENPRWWLAIGAFVGLGLLTKYSIVFYIAGILGGVVLHASSPVSRERMVLGRDRDCAADFSRRISSG